MKKNFEQVSITEATASTAEEKIKADKASWGNVMSFIKLHPIMRRVKLSNLKN